MFDRDLCLQVVVIVIYILIWYLSLAASASICSMSTFCMIERHCFSLMLHCCCASSTLAWSFLSVVKTIFVLVFGYPSNIDNERVLSWACSRWNWQNRPQKGKGKCFIGLVVELVEQRFYFLKAVGSFPTVGRVFWSLSVGPSRWLGLVIWLLGNVPFHFAFLWSFLLT